MKRLALFFVCTFSTCFFGFSCFWDYDTIEMERIQFPDVIELISGKFLRHSPEFYQWRIKDRTLRLQKSPDSLELYDDLAVAYSKIGNDTKAIQIILKKDSIAPKNYKTYANLGTFYIHNKQFSKGLEYIDKAIAINPNAHFGREIYQRHLVEYVMSKMKDGKITLPLSSELSPSFERYPRHKLDNFYNFLVHKIHNKTENSVENNTLSKKEQDNAIKGILGMMKFGNYNSPILLEALGDLLMANAWKDGARQLAARAYFKASYHSKAPETKEIYKQKVAFALYHQYTKKQGKRFTILELEKLLKQEIIEGNDFYQSIRNDEIQWIRLDQNPEFEFSKKYYQKPLLGVTIQKSNTSIDKVENDYQKFKSTNMDTTNLQSTSKDTIFLNNNTDKEIELTSLKKQIKIPKVIFLVIPIVIILLLYAFKTRRIK
ncbi:tetratricopeptide repeat protein [Aquimarina sp. 2201CG14-23]|uniref:tetratricopeptide repeat protein n=1 Tax=Aquimarina mycalae TaxID=3040073 RepID=UPI00247809B8|nr:hypothetical protein [Aquimarina sp. 2201CG14-23]MDH7446256.1 hypothetical protein [Aquimarina sp. 2201CG14-23]